MSDYDIEVWSVTAIEQNRRSLLRYVLAATGKMAVAEDLVQDTFQIAFENRAKFTAGTDLGAWLRGIARNRIHQYFDGTKQEPILCGTALDAMETAAAESGSRLIDGEWHERRLSALERCLEKITHRTRQIVEERYLRGKSAQEVADQFGITLTAVNVTVFRARGVLAECVQKETRE